MTIEAKLDKVIELLTELTGGESFRGTTAAVDNMPLDVEAPAGVYTAPAETPVETFPPPAEEPNREFLLSECKRLGIEVPPRTRTNTLKKWVADAAQAPPPAQQPPLDLGIPETPPAVHYNDMLAVLRELQQSSTRGNQDVIDTLMKFGVSVVSQVPPDQFAAVTQAARDLMAAKG